jgi:hypothetical protein
MTDNEIIKALEICGKGIMFSKHDCKKCPYYVELNCETKCKQNALDLINRQKAEIERFERENKNAFDKWKRLDERTKERYADLYEEAKCVVRADAVKEFAERLIEDRLGFVALENVTDEYAEGYHDALCCVEEQVDNLLKEFTEGEGK